MIRKLSILSCAIIFSLLALIPAVQPSLVVRAAVPEALPEHPAYLDAHVYPIIPALAGSTYTTARYYVQSGKRHGNHLHVFSKIGDSITAWAFFLTPIGIGQTQLGTNGDLAEAIAFFTTEPARTGNSFNNISLAANGGWTSADLLDPAKADHTVCQPNETPVACEIRVNQPSVALIMVGTNDLVSGDVRTFRANLSHIIAIVERNGTVPVISTIPYRRDNPALQDRVPAFNDVIIRLAMAYRLPLWNYWLAMENLPGNGVSNDGIHPSVPPDSQTAVFDAGHLQFGFNVRNLTALQVLKKLLPLLR